MRKLGIALLVILAVVVIVALALPWFLDVNRYHDRIQAELQKRLDRPVSLGRMHLSILPLAFRVENAVIGEDPNFGHGKPFAAAQELYVTAKLMPLIHGDVQVDSVELRNPQIELIRSPQGVWNFSSIGHNATGATTAPAAPPQQAPQQQQQQQQAAQKSQQQPEAFSLGKLAIRNGQIAITDLQKHQSRAVYDHIDLTVDGYAPGKAFDIDAAAHLPGQGAEKVQLTGKAGPVPEGTLTTMPFDGTLKLDQVAVSAAQKFLNTQALQGVEAIASGDTKIKNENGKIATSGTLKLDNAHIHGTDIGYPISLDYDLSDDLNSDVLNISKGNLKLGSTPLSLSGTLDTKPTPAQLDLKVNASNVSIEEAARLAAAFGVAFDPGMKISGKMNADIHAQGPATKPALNGTLSATNLDMAGKDLPSPVQVQGIDLALTPQNIRSNSFTASTGSTTLTAQFALANYTGPSPDIDMSLKTNGAKIGELLNIAKAYGVSSVNGMSGSGTIALDLHATGPLKNTGAMNFSGTGAIQQASLTMPQITKPLQVRNANLKFTQNSMIVDNLNAGVASTNATGSVTLRDFSAPQVQFSLNADRIIVAELEALFPNAPPAKQASLSLVPEAYAANPPQQPSMLSKTTGTGSLAVNTIQYDTMVLNDVRSNVTLDHGLIKLAPLTANVYGGKDTGSIVIDARPAQPVFTITTKLDQVDANKLLSSTTGIKQTLYGLLAANANNVTFTGANADQMAHSLNGTLDLNLIKGKIVGMDVLHQLTTIGKFLQGGQQADRGYSNILQLTGNFDIKNGLAQTNNLKAVIDGANLGGVGAINLADQTLNMHVTAVLPKSMSDMVGGTGIGGFMNTALANSKGELVLPIIVTGTFQHPSFAPDLQQIAQMRLQNMLPTSQNPGALTSGILGAIMGQKGQPGQQNQQLPQGQGGLQGILGALGGQQNRQQQQNQQQQQQQNQNNNQAQPQQQQRRNPLQDILGAIGGQQNRQQQQNQQQQQDQNQQQQQNQQQR